MTSAAKTRPQRYRVPPDVPVEEHCSKYNCRNRSTYRTWSAYDPETKTLVCDTHALAARRAGGLVEVVGGR